jgi:hypothetical protein
MNGGHHGRARMVVEILLKVAIITINQPTIYRCQYLPELDMTISGTWNVNIISSDVTYATIEND